MFLETLELAVEEAYTVLLEVEPSLPITIENYKIQFDLLNFFIYSFKLLFTGWLREAHLAWRVGAKLGF